MQLIHNAVVVAVFVAAGCANIPSVGPDYKELELEVPSYSLPDAGQPTSNLTQTAEYKPAEASDDSRVNVSATGQNIIVNQIVF